MNPHDARAMALDLMREHGLIEQGWRFKLDRAFSRFGLCSYTRRTIFLSLPLARAGEEEQVRGTILHEIAHAIAGPEAGHGPEWKRVARSLGTRPTACGELSADQRAVRLDAAKYSLDCPDCSFRHPRFRKPKTDRRYICPKCRAYLEPQGARRPLSFADRVPAGLVAPVIMPSANRE